MKKKKIILGVLIAVLTLGLVGGLITVKKLTYSPSKTALEYTKSTGQVQVEETDYGLKFVPQAEAKDLSIIFYQGALVEEASYAIWANQLAGLGYPVYVVHMPLNLAVLSGNKAQDVLKQENIHKYVIGGHSLGGVMAARFAANKAADALKGVFFLASYPDEKGNLKDSHLPVLSLTASEDQVLNWDHYQESKSFLPKDTTYLTIEGGNHGGFGSYGQQKDDGEAKITNEQQQDEIVTALSEWLSSIQ